MSTVKFIAPPEFGDVAQFVVEKSPEGNILPFMPFIIWVERTAITTENSLFNCQNCKLTYAITPASESFIDTVVNPSMAMDRLAFKKKIGYTGPFYVCSCIGRFVE